MTATLNGADQIGKNAAGQLYYKPAAADAFPAVYIDNTVAIAGNDGANYDGLDGEQLAWNSYVMEYNVKPVYGLDRAAVIASLNATAMARYNGFNLHYNTNGLKPDDWAALGAPPAGTGPGNHHTETIPQVAHTNLYRAATALVRTYATRLRVYMTLWRFNPDALVPGTDVATNAVPWVQLTVPPVGINATGPPGAKVTFIYQNQNNKRINAHNLSSFDI